MEKTCEFCRFRKGEECRRYPPVDLVRRIGDNNFNAVDEVTSEWPEIDFCDWCGEWQQKEEVKTK